MVGCTARRPLNAAFLLGVTLCFGCSGRFSTVSGKVTFDGEPVEKGTISFLPADGHGSTAADLIAAGQFSVRVGPGKYKVQINGFRKVGQRPASPGDPSSPMVDELEQIVPERYNTKTELNCDVNAGRQQADFTLASK